MSGLLEQGWILVVCGVYGDGFDISLCGTAVTVVLFLFLWRPIKTECGRHRPNCVAQEMLGSPEQVHGSSTFIMSEQECERCKISHHTKLLVRDRIRDHDSSILFGVLLAILRLPVGNSNRKGVLLLLGVGE